MSIEKPNSYQPTVKSYTCAKTQISRKAFDNKNNSDFGFLVSRLWYKPHWVIFLLSTSKELCEVTHSF